MADCTASSGQRQRQRHEDDQLSSVAKVGTGTFWEVGKVPGVDGSV